VQLVFFNNGPAPSASWISLALTFPRKLDSLKFTVVFDAGINESMNSSELELPQIVSIKSDEPWNNKIYVILVPMLHLNNTPFS